MLLPSPRDHQQCAKTHLATTLSSPIVSRHSLAEVSRTVTDWHYLDEGPCHICHTDLVQGALRSARGASILVRGWRQSAKYFEKPLHRERLVEAFSLAPHLEALADLRFRQFVAGE